MQEYNYVDITASWTKQIIWKLNQENIEINDNYSHAQSGN